MLQDSERDAILRDLIDLARQIVNKGLGLRAALDNQTPDLFELALQAYVRIESKFIAFGAAEDPIFPPPAGAEATDFGRHEWVKGRLTVIRELGRLDYDAHAWLEGTAEVVRRAGGIETFDKGQAIEGMSLRGWYRAMKSELEKLRAITIPADKFRRGHLKETGRGSEFLNSVSDLLSKFGINLDRLMAAAAVTAALGTLLVIVLVVLFLRR